MHRVIPLYHPLKGRIIVAAVSGGPDSIYLLYRLLQKKEGKIVVAHVNHGARGIESDKDQALVEKIAASCRLETVIRSCRKQELSRDRPQEGKGGARKNGLAPGFEARARKVRREFLQQVAHQYGSAKIAMAHTADDQVETILMRFFKGAGISGLKGIPRETDDGIVRPLLDQWKEEILRELKRRKIPYRVDRSNFDTSLERNWIRHVLLPMLERRYGRSVKKRIFTLGERFREIDEYLGSEAVRWIRRNVVVRAGGRTTERADVAEPRIKGVSRRAFPTSLRMHRAPFSKLPAVLRIRVLQQIAHAQLGLSPNERLFQAMDRTIASGGPSACMNIGGGWCLANRYGETGFERDTAGKSQENRTENEQEMKPRMSSPSEIAFPGVYAISFYGGRRMVSFAWEHRGKVTAAQARRIAAGGNAEVFDAAGLLSPLTVRPLRSGDRILTFGAASGGIAQCNGKKVKEILIDRKIPREERWGRPVVCDAKGYILWIPGVVRSCHAPVTADTRESALLKIASK